jgi:hypothetical protein
MAHRSDLSFRACRRQNAVPRRNQTTGLVGWCVDCFCFDGARLLFLYSPGGSTTVESYELSLRTRLILTFNDSGAVTVDPRGPHESLALLIALVGGVVVRAQTSSDGTLVLAFADGKILKIAPDDELEAWELVAVGCSHTICEPGGAGVATFASSETPCVTVR